MHQGLFEKSYQPINNNWYDEGTTSAPIEMMDEIVSLDNVLSRPPSRSHTISASSANKENRHFVQKRSETNQDFSEVVNFYPLPDEEPVLERPIRRDKHWETLSNQIDRLLKSKLIDKVNEPMEPTKTCRPTFKEFQFTTGTLPNDLLPGHQGNFHSLKRLADVIT